MSQFFIFNLFLLILGSSVSMSLINEFSLTLTIQDLTNPDINQILYKFLIFGMNKTNMDLILDSRNKYHFQECFNYINNAFIQNTNKNSSNISQLLNAFEYSGKYLGDYGFENECKSSKNLSFFLLNYTLYLNDFNETDQYQEMLFTNQENFYTGICIFKPCIVFLHNFFNSTINQPFTDYLYQQAHIKEINFIFPYDFCTRYNSQDNTIYNGSEIHPICNETGFNPDRELPIDIFGYLFVFYILFLIICSIGKIIFFFKFEFEKDHLKKEATENSFEENFISLSNPSEKDSIEESIKQEKQEPIFNNLKSVFDGEDQQKKKKKTLLKIKIFEIIKVFDFFSNLFNISTSSNYYYNEKGIESLPLIRVIVMLGMTYYLNFNAYYWIPPKDVYNKTFYQSYSFFIIKLSTFCYVTWVILDGIIMTYKLMSYFKMHLLNKPENTVSFKLFLKFISFSIPKIITYLVLFFILYFCGEGWGTDKQWFFLNSGVMYKYSFNMVFKQRKCYNSPYLLFFPFREGSFNFESCYPFTFILYNEFLCWILVLVIFYFAMKFQSKKYELVLFIFFSAYFLGMFIFLNLKDFNKKLMTLSIFNGETITIRQPYFIMLYYMLGVFLGLCYFYFNDSLSNTGFVQSNSYFPFKFCYDVIKKLHKFKFKYLVIIGTLLAIFLFSFFGTPAFVPNYDIKDNGWVKFCFFSDKILFSLFFVIISMNLIVYPKDTAFKQLIKTNIFIIFERINITYLCISEWMIYFTYSKFLFQLNLSYQNLFFVSIGITIIIIGVSIVLTIFIEVPMRKLIKFLIRNKNWEKINHERLEEDLGLDNDSSSRSESFNLGKKVD